MRSWDATFVLFVNNYKIKHKKSDGSMAVNMYYWNFMYFFLIKKYLYGSYVNKTPQLEFSNGEKAVLCL